VPFAITEETLNLRGGLHGHGKNERLRREFLFDSVSGQAIFSFLFFPRPCDALAWRRDFGLVETNDLPRSKKATFDRNMRVQRHRQTTRMPDDVARGLQRRDTFERVRIEKLG